MLHYQSTNFDLCVSVWINAPFIRAYAKFNSACIGFLQMDQELKIKLNYANNFKQF